MSTQSSTANVDRPPIPGQEYIKESDSCSKLLYAQYAALILATGLAITLIVVAVRYEKGLMTFAEAKKIAYVALPVVGLIGIGVPLSSEIKDCWSKA